MTNKSRLPTCEKCRVRSDDVTQYASTWLCESCVSEIVTHAPGYERGDDPAPHIERALAGWLDVWCALDRLKDRNRRDAIEACIAVGDSNALALARTLIRGGQSDLAGE